MKTRQWMVAIAAAGTLLAACNNALEPEEEITTGSISGLVYEATSGSAVPMASITTVPPSSSVTTELSLSSAAISHAAASSMPVRSGD